MIRFTAHARWNNHGTWTGVVMERHRNCFGRCWRRSGYASEAVAHAAATRACLRFRKSHQKRLRERRERAKKEAEALQP